MADRRTRLIRTALVPALALAFSAGACAEENTIVADEAEKSVVDVAKQEGVTATDVSCPDGVEAKVGDTFECTYTSEGDPYVAVLEMTKVEDELVVFDITSRPDN